MAELSKGKPEAADSEVLQAKLFDAVSDLANAGQADAEQLARYATYKCRAAAMAA
jgi:hypothetical protein